MTGKITCIDNRFKVIFVKLLFKLLRSEFNNSNVQR